MRLSPQHQSCATIEVVQGAFGTVVFVVSAVGIVGAVLGLLLNRRTWDQYGKDHLLLDSELPQARLSSSSTELVERDEEVRQMLEARNARRRRRGKAEVDVEHELARLTTPAVDAGLREEIREDVRARWRARSPS